jgi:hypothetical protein
MVWGLSERSLGGHFAERFEAFVDCKDLQAQWDFVNEYGTRSDREGAELRSESNLNGRKLVFAGSARFVGRCKDLHDRLLIAELPGNVEVGVPAREMGFQDWASLAWYHVVDSHNVDHLSAGVRVERVRSWGGVMSYCAKYMSKADSGFLSDVQFGRSWGIFNRVFVPWAKMIEIDLDDDVGNRLRRIARHYMEKCRSRRIQSPYGFTLYCDVKNWRRLWERPPPDPF